MTQATITTHTAADVANVVKGTTRQGGALPAWFRDLGYTLTVTCFDYARTGRGHYTLDMVRSDLAPRPTTASGCAAHTTTPATFQSEPAWVKGTAKALYTRLLLTEDFHGPLHGYVSGAELEIAISAIYFYTGVGCRAIRHGAGWIVESVGADLGDRLPNYPAELPLAPTTIFTITLIDRMGALSAHAPAKK
jgi:hypothetical protein